jgi:hypothetical protein
MTPSQFRQALETLAFTDGSRMVVQLASGQNISGRFQTLLTNGIWSGSLKSVAPKNGNG